MSDEQDELEFDPIEGYCMSCRETVEIEEPQAVWTRKGQPATRGMCPLCGGTVFRMGKTELHDELRRPQPVKIGDGRDKRTAPKLARDTVYLNYSEADEALAQRLAHDLEKIGISVWLHDGETDVSWSSGVHPALKACQNMVYILSSHSLHDTQVSDSWRYFREQRKPIVIAQVGAFEPPDAIRRSTRCDFTRDYKSALRELVRAISG